MTSNTRSSIPLGILLATFVLPMADNCNHTVSPLTYIAETGWGGALWVLPTFVVAGVLFMLTALRRSPGRGALYAMGGLVGTLPVLAALFARDTSWLSIFYATSAAVSAWLLGRAFRRSGPEQLHRLLDTFAVAALPLALAILALGKYAGAYLFEFAFVAFATQRLLLLKQPREPAASDDRVRVGASASAVRIVDFGEPFDEVELPSEVSRGRRHALPSDE